jgi:hypothetical protein
MTAWYEPGRYRVEIVNAALGESKEKGTPQVEVTILPKGVYGGGGQLLECADQPRTVYLPLTEACLGTAENTGWVMKTLAAFGFVGPSFNDLQPLIGKVADAQCVIESFDGEDREKWSLRRPYGQAPPRPAEKKTIRSLDAKYAGLLKTARNGVPSPKKENEVPSAAPTAIADPKKNGRKRATVPAEPPPAEDDGAAPDTSEDIPF